MCDTGFTVKQLVTHLRELKREAASEAKMLDVVPLLAQRLVASRHNWLRPRMCMPNAGGRDSAGLFRLHEEEDHTLSVVVVTWLPGDETPPHDHGTWAVIAGLEGHETNHWWKRLDDGTTPGYADVRRAGRERIDPASCVAMPGDAIHSLHNDSGAVSVTLHLYGRNVDFTDRRKFDPARHATAPYRMGGTTQPLTSRQ